ncbi:TrkH family potassium uptake protein [Methanocrinis sp.]|uniref:TrkH family potassium uptake protein n=1 Tax=Methanocrinis sp. TaxID=3101522 RepID=UPI003D0DB6B5
MRVRVFLKVFGTLLKLLGALMLIPAAVSLIYGEVEGVIAFVVPAIFVLVLGLVIELLGVEEVLSNKEGFALVAFGWLGAAASGALPYILLGLSPIDALFESMSGFTTTGATILSQAGADGLWAIDATAASQSVAVSLAHIVFQDGPLSSVVGPAGSNISAVNETLLNASLNGTLSGGETGHGSALNGSEGTYRGLLFWRSFTQWLGGMGIIVLFIAILPNLGVAGRQLFKAEVPGPREDLIRPRIRETAKILWGVYMVLTAAEFLLLMLAKMPAYDAICNTFSTVSTGGFSPRVESIAYYSLETIDHLDYNAPLIEVVVIVFMFLSGANFALHYRSMYVNRKSLARDSEFRFYSLLVLLSITVAILIGGIDNSFPEETDPGGLERGGLYLRTAAFTVVSIITTTGFATADYDLWSGPAKLILFMLMFTGACAGSTAGGMKLIRILLTMKYGRRELFQALHPKAVMAVKLKGSPVKEDVLHSILIFIALYVLIFALASVIFASVCPLAEEKAPAEIVCFVSGEGEGQKVICFGSEGWNRTDELLGLTPREGGNVACFVAPENAAKRIEVDRRPLNLSEAYHETGEIACFRSGDCSNIDMISAASAVATTLGNVGPGFNRFGPTDDYSELPGPGKLVLIVCMWMGRLEILTVLVLFVPDFWKS